MGEGLTALHAEDYERARECFARAVQADWRHAPARLFLARAQGLAGRASECAIEMERLVQIAPRDAALLIEAGQTLEKFGLFEQAGGLYERALGADAASVDARVRLASNAERLHRLEQAESFASEALTRNPLAHEATLVLARVQRRTGRGDAAIETLQGTLTRSEPPDFAGARLWYELASVFDGQGRFKDAASALGRAKLLLAERRRVLAPAGEEAEYTLRRFAQELTPSRVQQWIEASAGLASARISALVGFPRSGTTLLEQVLAAHPLIESVEESQHLSTELVTGFYRAVTGADSLAQVLDRIAAGDVRRCRENYLRAMAAHVGGPLGEKWLLDKNPIRTLMMPVLRRAVPGAPFVVALRDPRDVVLSNLMQAFEPSAMNVAFLDVAHAGAFYALHMGGWLKLREMIDGWIEVRYEDVVVDPPAQARRVLDLLALPWHEALDHFQDATRGRAVRSPTYAAVREQVHTRAVRRFEHYADYLAPALPAIEPIIKALGYA